MKKYEINAYTLAEALIVLFVVALTSIAALPIITNAKTKGPDHENHGQFACYYNGGVKQWSSTERKLETSAPQATNGSCIFPKNLSAEGFLVYMVGPGAPTTGPDPGKYTQGQFISSYIHKIEQDVVINIGDPNYADTNNPENNPNPKSLTTFGGSNPLTALGGTRVSDNSKLVGKNIQSCSLRTASRYDRADKVDGTRASDPVQNRCVVSFDFPDPKNKDSGVQRSCQLVFSNRSPIASGSVDTENLKAPYEYKIQINGCRRSILYYNPQIHCTSNCDSSKATSTLKVDGTWMENDLTIGLKELTEKKDTSDNSVYYEYKDGDYKFYMNDHNLNKEYTYEIALKLADTEYVPSRSTVSKMAELLKTLPPTRQTKISDEIIRLKPGVNNAWGAVFIIW